MDQAFHKNPLKAVICSCLLMLVFSHAHAQNKVVVVPLLGDINTASDISNVVTVAKSGGDFSNPVAAMNSINDASADNPYLIAIAPGTYSITETLVAKPYVSILGSGQSSTIIRAGSNNVRTTLETASYGSTTISNLTIQNIAGNRPFCNGIFDDGGARLTYLTVEVRGCTSGNLAIESVFGGPSIDNTTVRSSGAGIALSDTIGPSVLENINIRALGVGLSIGPLEPDSVVTILDSTIRGGENAIEITNVSGQEYTARLVNSVISTNINGFSTSGTGISINNTTKMIVRTSSITGETTSLDADSTSTFIVSSSSLIGGVSGAGVKKCVASDNGDGEELTSACLEN